MNIDIFKAEVISLAPTETLSADELRRCVTAFPASVRKALKTHKCCVAGGFVRDIVVECDTPKDIDIFTTSKDAAAAIAVDLLETAPYVRLNGTEKRIVETGNAFTIVSGYKEPAPQVIFRWVFDDMNKVIDAFDFTPSQAAIWWDGEKFVSRCAPTFHNDAMTQTLVFTSPKDNDPLGSVLRMMKFYRAGYVIDNENLSRVLADVCYDYGSRFNELSLEGIQKSIRETLPSRGLGKY